MLTSAPTKFGAGITVYGDFLDIDSVHRTIHKIASEDVVEERISNFILGLAYDLRKAKENKRETRKLGIDKNDAVNYKGVAVLWPYFLVQVAMLRRYAGYRNTDQRDQACLYLLEACAINSLLAFDLKAGRECIELFLNFPPFPSDYLFEFLNDCARRFVSLPGKRRFQELPRLLKSMLWMSSDYAAFERLLKENAEKQGCSPHDLHDTRDWPDFKW